MTGPAKPTIDEQRLQNQLAACQKECKEQARLNGMGSEREAKLMAQLAELQAKYDGLVRAAEALRDGLPEQDPYASELVAALADELAKLNGGKG